MANRMSKRTWSILAVVIIAVAAIVAVALSNNSSGPSDLTLPIITWNETTLSELQGTPAVLVFWATWCPHCPTNLRYLEAVAEESEEKMKVVAIDVGESASRVQEFFGDHKPTMTIALDSKGEAFVHYCLSYNNTRGSIPFTLFIDSQGIVKYWQVGAFASETALWAALDDVFGITTPETS